MYRTCGIPTQIDFFPIQEQVVAAPLLSLSSQHISHFPFLRAPACAFLSSCQTLVYPTARHRSTPPSLAVVVLRFLPAHISLVHGFVKCFLVFFSRILRSMFCELPRTLTGSPGVSQGERCIARASKSSRECMIHAVFGCH